MKIIKCISLEVATLLLATAVYVPQTASANTYGEHGPTDIGYWMHKHRAIVTKSIRIYQYTKGTMYTPSHRVRSFKLHRGQIIHIKNGTYTNWKVYGRKYVNNKHYETGSNRFKGWFTSY
ncbi:hypothetical protein DIS15_02960 [Levilactobacillus brevis]|uniref:hypothetical protein n=1 Tax=Levilactobacillus brevis TaxID=1580 RepID=UPI001120512D|nr:hypothetical protein [Levilactobacillus brevis]TOY85760.1 hypothetical protein DIS15_02960 [Levilactobacillus brevis]